MALNDHRCDFEASPTPLRVRRRQASLLGSGDDRLLEIRGGDRRFQPDTASLENQL